MYVCPLLSVSWLPLTEGQLTVDIGDMELDVEECMLLIPAVELAELCAEELLVTTDDIIPVLLTLDVPSNDIATAASTPALVEVPRN